MIQEMQHLPTFEGYGYFSHGEYVGEDGSLTHGFWGVSADEVRVYLGQLTVAGFAAYTAKTFGPAEFYTLTRGSEAVRVSYYPTVALMKVVYTKGAYLPAREAAPYEKKVPASITQPARKGAELRAPGMEYVLQAEDGSYIIIDGGFSQAEDEADLLAFMQAHNPNEGKPVIAMWIISHPHPDHIQLGGSFLEKYGSEVELRMIAQNYPNVEMAPIPHEDWEHNIQPHIDRFRKAAHAAAPDLIDYTYHTGDTFFFPGLRFEVIFTQEDYYPHTFGWVNHVSSVLLISGADKCALMLGDAEKPICQQMADAYGEALKCDILQCSHHGFNGACQALYYHADPDICFWAVDKERFENDPRPLGQFKGQGFNAFLRNPGIKVREHYHNSESVTVLL